MKTVSENTTAASGWRWLRNSLLASTFLAAAGFATGPAYSATATVSVWNIVPTFGFNPDASKEDIAGVTAQVATAANPLSVAFMMDNDSIPIGPCAIVFFNPVTNFFKGYGIGGGFADGVDVNTSAPSFTGPDGGVFGKPTFQIGDAWGTITGSPPLFVVFKGTGNFRRYSGFTARGVKVDPATGKVFFADTSGGNLNLLDPATNGLTTWSVGGNPFYIAEDSAGNIYATQSAGPSGDAIIKLHPSTGALTTWAIPGGGLSTGTEQADNGIALDSAGNVKFALTATNELGRLNPSTGQICKFTKPGLTMSPQQPASSGAGSTLQTFFTEAGSATDLMGAVSVATDASLTPEVSPCPLVTPTTKTITPTSSTATFSDVVVTATTATITPTTTTVTGVDPSGILRFPMPFPTGGSTSTQNEPSGMTGVIMGNSVAGSYQSEAFGTFGANSAVFLLTSGAIVAKPGPCTSADATLANVKFPHPGEVTLDLSSPSRVMTSISLFSSVNIGTFTLPSIVAGGHMATGGDFKKADPTKSATFEMEITFASGTPSACLIDPRLKGRRHHRRPEAREAEARFEF